MTSGFRSARSNRVGHRRGRCAAISLGPYCSSRRSASSVVKPSLPDAHWRSASSGVHAAALSMRPGSQRPRVGADVDPLTMIDGSAYPGGFVPAPAYTDTRRVWRPTPNYSSWHCIPRVSPPGECHVRLCLSGRADNPISCGHRIPVQPVHDVGQHSLSVRMTSISELQATRLLRWCPIWLVLASGTLSAPPTLCGCSEVSAKP